MNLCIHGHFYQPPREDPISNYIPAERGCEPFCNWNEKISAECYEQNAEAGNFAKISFNVGPTLFSWMQAYRPDVAKQIVEQEIGNFEKFGVGNGMAQSYNHTILPLANYQDKETQVRWGIDEFVFRFGHQPAGMWLPEAAVDMETLCVLSDHGLKFVILAPWQVQALEAKPGPYYVQLPGGRQPFVVFPYRQDLSTMVSFIPQATENGDYFLRTVRNSLSDHRDDLNIVASDGELYGHHQKFRNHFLTYVLNRSGQETGIDWTYPGLWLLENEVKTEAILHEPSSWSCFHGVDRWSKECACTPGADWKKPFMEVMREIASWLDQIYFEQLSKLVSDPWELRHRYIQVVNGQISIQELIAQFIDRVITDSDISSINLLMKAQFERQRMFTSCGWFFEEFHRIEPQNNIAYAANAVWLTQKASGETIDPAIIRQMADVRSKKTGLRADTIFTQTLVRAENET